MDPERTGPALAMLDHLRKYFQTSNHNIFETIESAILLAAQDFPREFIQKRHFITEALCNACHALPKTRPLDSISDKTGNVKLEENKVKNSKGSNEKDVPTEMNNGSGTGTGIGMCNGTKGQVLVDIEKESSVQELLKIKKVLMNMDEEEEEVIFELLKKLLQMQLSYEVLEVTDIGWAVSRFKRHNSKPIRSHVRSLIKSWKNIVDEWAAIFNNTTIDNSTGPSSCTKIMSTHDFQGPSTSNQIGPLPFRNGGRGMRCTGDDPLRGRSKSLKAPLQDQRKPPIYHPNKVCEKGSIREMLELAKRKFPERCQLAENAKKQRAK